MDDVRLPDLEVIKRFSIAVRREHAPAEEVIAALRADLAAITGRGRERETVERQEPLERPRRPALPRPRVEVRRAPVREKPVARRKPARAAARKKTKRR